MTSSQKVTSYNIIPKLLKNLGFDAKHAYSKSRLVLNKNRKNIIQSMAKQYQMSMVLSYTKVNLLEHKILKCITSQEKTLKEFNDVGQKVIRQHLVVEDNDLIIACEAVEFVGQRHSTGEAVIITYDCDNYVFGKIRSACFFFKSDVFVLCQVLNIIEFNTHFNSYYVEVTDQICVRRIFDFLDYHPLGIYKVNDSFFIPMRYYVRPNNEN